MVVNSDPLSLFGLPPSRGYCAKMLRKGGFGGPVYVSAKRTHRFRRQKEGLSDCEASRSDRSFNRFSVGSFWKTNPPEGCFSGFLVDLYRFWMFLQLYGIGNATRRRAFVRIDSTGSVLGHDRSKPSDGGCGLRPKRRGRVSCGQCRIRLTADNGRPAVGQNARSGDRRTARRRGEWVRGRETRAQRGAQAGAGVNNLSPLLVCCRAYS